MPEMLKTHQILHYMAESRVSRVKFNTKKGIRNRFDFRDVPREMWVYSGLWKNF